MNTSWPHSKAVGETSWELPSVQTVYGYNVTEIELSHSCSEYQFSMSEKNKKIKNQLDVHNVNKNEQ